MFISIVEIFLCFDLCLFYRKYPTYQLDWHLVGVASYDELLLFLVWWLCMCRRTYLDFVLYNSFFSVRAFHYGRLRQIYCKKLYCFNISNSLLLSFIINDPPTPPTDTNNLVQIVLPKSLALRRYKTDTTNCLWWSYNLNVFSLCECLCTHLRFMDFSF